MNLRFAPSKATKEAANLHFSFCAGTYFWAIPLEVVGMYAPPAVVVVVVVVHN